jgi:hypothetical protein
MSNINISRLLEQSAMRKQAEHEVAAEAKRGNLRAGNTGIVLHDGNFAGKCPRLAVLRYHEIESVADANTQLMFSMGNYNEEIFIASLKAQLGAGYEIRSQDEAGTLWVTAGGGHKVTGSPDTLIVISPDGTPALGVELKSICSVWTARSVLLEGQPQLAHLCQAGHYMWQVGVPFKLVYTNYVNYEYPFTNSLSKEVQEKVTPEWIHADKIEFRGKKPGKIRPFHLIYDLRWNPGTNLLEYREENDGGFWTETDVSVEGIKEYFEAVSTAIVNKQLPQERPLTISVTGKRLNYTICDPKYCDFSDSCAKYEGYYDKWLASCKKVVDKMKEDV